MRLELDVVLFCARMERDLTLPITTLTRSNVDWEIDRIRCIEEEGFPFESPFINAADVKLHEVICFLLLSVCTGQAPVKENRRGLQATC